MNNIEILAVVGNVFRTVVLWRSIVLVTYVALIKGPFTRSISTTHVFRNMKKINFSLFFFEIFILDDAQICSNQLYCIKKLVATSFNKGLFFAKNCADHLFCCKIFTTHFLQRLHDILDFLRRNMVRYN